MDSLSRLAEELEDSATIMHPDDAEKYRQWARGIREGFLSEEQVRNLAKEHFSNIIQGAQMKAEVTAVIPTIPVRRNMLARAIDSVYAQTFQPVLISTELDRKRRGSAETRNRALDAVETKWSAFLDDDDYWLPIHVMTLMEAAKESGADVIYSGCVVVDRHGDEIPRQEEWGRFGLKFDPDLLREKSYLPVTSLVLTELAKEARFGPPSGTDSHYDDWGFYVRLLDLGAKFVHVPEVTWIWPHWGGNTSGRADRW